MTDLRSDTVTKPTSAMLESMANAPVGDDVFGEDPSINELEGFAAELFGKEAGLFCPSGTMSNQIAIKVQTQPGGEVICDEGAHIYYYEGGGIAFNSGCSTRTLTGNRGVFTAEQLKEALRPSDIHFPAPQLVSIENTCNRGGGKIFGIAEIEAIREVCLQNGLRVHLDGARLFNALVASETSPKSIGQYFDSISICLSKGLGAPVGSVLLSDAATIKQARRVRKVLGGGMRQAGLLAAAGMYALQNHVKRLSTDHLIAKQIETVLNDSPIIKYVLPVETNIIVFELKETINAQQLIDHLLANGIRALTVGKNMIRFVTHLDIPENTASQIASALASFNSNIDYE